jgi:Uroporphyrinogen decarboxylase (URO-D)
MSGMAFTERLDAGKSPEQLLAERGKRIQDALELKQPDRIPVHMPAGYLLAEYGGVTHRQQQDDWETAQDLLEKFASELQPDVTMGLFNNPRPSLALGDRMTKWPGYSLPDTGSFQFDEHEFMKGEDYDDFLRDPSDWAIRSYLPRAFKELEGLQYLPPFGMWAFGHYHLGNLPMYAIPPVQAALQALGKAIELAAADGAKMGESIGRMAALGFPPTFLAGSLIEAPFDFMSDTLRGMRGIMLDIHRRPEKLLPAMEKCLTFQLEYAINFRRATGLKMCFIPLHRGSDGFMSLPQFEKFYWPTLKTMQEVLVENDIIPFVFYEGVWDQRLKYLTELPKGKVAGLFQFSDIFKVKEVVGDTMCIAGGMRNSLLQAGTAEEVREWTKKVCQVVGKNGGFVMTTGIGEMEGCQPELVKAWVDATKEYGAY